MRISFLGFIKSHECYLPQEQLGHEFFFLVILALSALRSGDADGCTSPYDEGPYTVEILHLSVPITKSVRFILIAVPTVEGKFPVV